MQESYVGTALFTQVSRLHPLLGWNALYSTLWVTVFTHARAVVRYVRFIRPGYSSTINRENTAIQISAGHHGLNTMGNRAKKTMNTNQRHLGGLLSPLFAGSTSIAPHAALYALRVRWPQPDHPIELMKSHKPADRARKGYSVR